MVNTWPFVSPVPQPYSGSDSRHGVTQHTTHLLKHHLGQIQKLIPSNFWMNSTHSFRFHRHLSAPSFLSLYWYFCFFSLFLQVSPSLLQVLTHHYGFMLWSHSVFRQNWGLQKKVKRNLSHTTAEVITKPNIWLSQPCLATPNLLARWDWFAGTGHKDLGKLVWLCWVQNGTETYNRKKTNKVRERPSSQSAPTPAENRTERRVILALPNTFQQTKPFLDLICLIKWGAWHQTIAFDWHC